MLSHRLRLSKKNVFHFSKFNGQCEYCAVELHCWSTCKQTKRNIVCCFSVVQFSSIGHYWPSEQLSSGVWQSVESIVVPGRLLVGLVRTIIIITIAISSCVLLSSRERLRCCTGEAIRRTAVWPTPATRRMARTRRKSCWNTTACCKIIEKWKEKWMCKISLQSLHR